MGTPQIIMISLIALSGGIAMAQHGKPKKGKESFGVFLFSATFQVGLLYWGGFFG